MDRLAPPLLLASMLCAGCTGEPGGDSALCSEADRAVDWESFGVGFFSGYCRGCHSAGVDNRYGAPAAVDFDSLDQVRTHASAVRATVLEDATMPVGGGVDEEDLLLLDRFLACGL
jgi:uncharacterized membrane protein